MKKTARNFLIAILGIVSLFALVACNGSNNAKGEDGKSAYQIWLDNGNSGTESDFLNWLKGAPDSNGVNGKSAYELAVEKGYTGTLNEWLLSLVGSGGTDGKSAYEIWLENDNTGTESDFLNSLKGKSAFEIYQEYYEYKGSEEQWIDDLINGRLAKYTVMFDSNGGSSVLSIGNLAKGSKITEPAAPTHSSGFIFAGWYKERKCIKEWVFDDDTVMWDLTLYAKWGYEVTVTKNGTGTVVGNGVYSIGASVTVTATPGDGFGFWGWYENDEFKSHLLTYSFEVSRSVTLTAKFIYGIVTPAADYESGSGTELCPYVIKNKNQLALLALLTNNVSYYSRGKYFELGANINIGGAKWIPIGDYFATEVRSAIYYFLGSFEGNNFTVSNFTNTDFNPERYNYRGIEYIGHYFGFFGTLYSAKVQNLKLEVAYDLNNEECIYAGGLSSLSTLSTITNCSVKGTMTVFSDEYIRVGGLIADSSNDKIIGCHADIVMDLTSLSEASIYSNMAGGLVSFVSRDTEIFGCSAEGEIRISGMIKHFTVGGFIGHNQSTIMGIIKYCSANVEVNVSSSTTHNSFYVGGFIGLNYSGIVTKCYSESSVNASAVSTVVVGGFIGSNRASVSQCYATGNVTTSSATAYAGGLIGRNYSSITECYASGDVTVTSWSVLARIGGLVGQTSGIIQNCFATGDIYTVQGAGSISVGGLAGLTEASVINSYFMQEQSIMIGEEIVPTAGMDGECITSEALNNVFYLDILEWDETVWVFNSLDSMPSFIVM